MSASSHSPNFDDLSDDEDQTRTFKRIWTLLRRSDEGEGPSYDVDREWTRLADRLDLPADTAPDTPAQGRRPVDRAPRARRGRRWTRALAVVALALLVAGAGIWWWSQPVSVRTTAGERTVVTLPDGSTAELNGGTTLSYPRGFSSLPGVEASVRRVTLKGEAFFSVTARDRPFRVETTNARVAVLGTEFHVRTRATGAPTETTVTVALGRVRVTSASADDAEASVVLDAEGETSRVRGSAVPSAPEAVELKYVEAWRQGGFAVRDAPLPRILRALERRFGVPLELSAPAAETDAMSLHYGQDAQLQAILRDICLGQHLSYRRTPQGYELVRSEE